MSRGFAIFIGRNLTQEEFEVYDSHPNPKTMHLDGYPVEPIASGEPFVIQQKLKDGVSLKRLQKPHDKRYKLWVNEPPSSGHSTAIATSKNAVAIAGSTLDMDQFEALLNRRGKN